MAKRINADGSISIGILPAEEVKPTEERAEKPAPVKKKKKAKAE